jgi:WD40 repeat protein
VWDLLRGEVHKVLGGKEGHSGKVNDLVFTEGSTFLFSCSDDLQVIKWNIENGEIVAYALSLSLSILISVYFTTSCCDA